MQDIEISKATGVDKLLWRFLKDGTDILTKPVFVNWNNFNRSSESFWYNRSWNLATKALNN